MPTLERSFEVHAPVEVVMRFHGSTAALRWLTPPPMVVRVHQGGLVTEGMVAKFTLWLGPIPLRWTARHELVRDRSFVDVQERGPFAHWRHRHVIEANGANRCRVRDVVEYEYRKGARGVATRLLMGRASLKILFRYRAAVTRACCERGWGPARAPAG